jgi:recombination protein RecR
MEVALLEQLMRSFSRLPGLGPRSARRVVLHLFKGKRGGALELADTLMKVAKEIKTCALCGNLDTASPCGICSNTERDGTVVCVVEDVVDLWAMERSKVFHGKYHIIGGTLSAIDGRTAEKLNLAGFVTRLERDGVKEVIIATNSTLDGQTTGFYIADLIENLPVKISRLANGIPLGAELDYLDEGTLLHAMQMRRNYQ